jgi:hypothetical protein
VKKMTDESRGLSWLRVIAEAAKEQGVALPPFGGRGMGTARSGRLADGRFITFKRRLVLPARANVDGVEWTLWSEQDDLPVPIAVFREPQEPTRENVMTALALIKGWLIDGWTPDEARAAVGTHPRARPVEELPLGPPRIGGGSLEVSNQP